VEGLPGALLDVSLGGGGLVMRVVDIVPVVGDANHDGVVDADDYIILKRHMGAAAGAGASEGDFNDSGTVDWDDLQILVGAFNAAGGQASAVPEPASLAMLALAATAVVRRRRA